MPYVGASAITLPSAVTAEESPYSQHTSWRLHRPRRTRRQPSRGLPAPFSQDHQAPPGLCTRGLSFRPLGPLSVPGPVTSIQSSLRRREFGPTILRVLSSDLVECPAARHQGQPALCGDRGSARAFHRAARRRGDVSPQRSCEFEAQTAHAAPAAAPCIPRTTPPELGRAAGARRVQES